jgi:hypothetical protein
VTHFARTPFRRLLRVAKSNHRCPVQALLAIEHVCDLLPSSGTRHNPVTRSRHSAVTHRVSLREQRHEKDKSVCLRGISNIDGVLRLTSDGRAQNEMVLSYVTFYGFDDNDDGNPTHLGTDVISHAAVHDSANEDLGTYERPGTLAADVGFLSPGTKVYVPALERYYVMEDTCRECSEDWLQNKPHIDLYVSGTGPELVACQERLTMESQNLHRSPAWSSRKAWASMQELDKHRTRCSSALPIRAF